VQPHPFAHYSGCRDYLYYKLSSRNVGHPVFQTSVLLDKEKNSIILRAINNTDIGLCVPIFAANKEREVHLRACHSVSTNITQSIEKMDGKIIHNGFTLIGDHGETKVIDQLGVAILVHSVSVGIS
jgi:hypothetical protein